MKLKVVLLTRPWQSDAAQMAWRLLRSGADVSIIIETREKKRPAKFLLRLFSKAGWDYSFRLLVENLGVRAQFLMRKYFKQKYANAVYRSAEELALDSPVQIFKVKNRNDKAVEEILAGFKPDAGMALRACRPAPEILEIPPLGFYGLHLRQEEDEAVIAVFRFSEDKKSDAIVAEHRLSRFSFDDAGSCRERALWYGTYLAAKTLHEIDAGIPGTAPPRKDLKKGSGPRVLHVMTRMVRGGAQKNTLATVNGLLSKGYQVTLVSGPSWGDEDEILHEALEQNLEVLILPELVREINPWADLLAVWKLRRLMRRFPFEIVHTHTSKAGLLGRLAAYWARVPLVVHTPHGHVFHSYFPAWKEKIFLVLERLAARGTDRLVALTVQCRNEHRSLGIGQSGQWSVIPSGVDETSVEDFSACRNEILDSLKIPRDRKIIGYIGRLAPVKGCFYLIRALLPIYWSKLNFHCLIVGDGEDRKELESLAAGIGLKSRVTFTGYQKNISKWLSIFDVLAVPSLNEGMGRVIVEAGILKKPVIASEVGGIKDLIESEQTGLLVPSRDSYLLSGAILYLLENPAKAAEFGRNLHRKVLENFTESQMVEKIDQLYQQLLIEKQTGIPSPALEEQTVL